MTKFMYYGYDYVCDGLASVRDAGVISESTYQRLVEHYRRSVFPWSNWSQYGDDVYKTTRCMNARLAWADGGEPPEQDFSQYHLDPNWKNYQDTLDAMSELKSQILLRRQQFVDHTCTLDDLRNLVDQFVALAPSIARHDYNWNTYDEFDPIAKELIMLYRSIFLAVSFRWLKNDGVTKDQMYDFWSYMYTNAYQALMPTDDIAHVYSNRTLNYWNGQDYVTYYSGQYMKSWLLGYLCRFDKRYSSVISMYTGSDTGLPPKLGKDQNRYGYCGLQQTGKMCEEGLFDYTDTWSENLCSDLEGWSPITSWYASGYLSIGWSYDETFGFVYDNTIRLVYNPNETGGNYRQLQAYNRPDEPTPPEPPEPPEPTPPDPPEPTPVKYLFYSSNHDLVKTMLKECTPLREVNTNATGYDRKWFLLDTSELSFNFETYTGFVIEYGPTGLDDSGLVKSWNLSQYYSVIDEQTHEVSVESRVIQTNLDMEGSPLSDDDVYQLTHDPYIKGYMRQYHQVRYESSTDGRQLLLGPVDEEPIYTATCTDGVLMKDENNEPVKDGDNYIYYIAPKQDPWTVKWKAVDGNLEDVPVVENISQTTYQHRIRTVDALEFIAGYTSVLGTHSESYLYRSLTTADKLADPLADQMFVAVFNSTDGRTAPVLNDIGYAPTEVNEQGEVVPVVDEDVSPDPIEVGTRTAKGALYYRDSEATAFDYSLYGLDTDMMYTICKMWYDRHKNGITDTQIYQDIIKQFKTDHPSIVLNYTLLRKIVSNTDSCYFSPWKKLISCSSANAIQHYVDYLSDARIDPYSDLFGAHAGYISIMEANLGEGELTNYVPHYLNLVSIVDRTIQGEETKYTTHDFVINPESTSWNEIDHWPWEYTEPWICMRELSTDDHLFQTRSDISIEYNSTLSCTKVLHAPGDVDLREGEAKVAEERSVVYGVDMIHCDYKLKLSEDAAYANYMEDIRDLLRAYFNELKAITPSLLARTKLYFSPIRTFGSAEFKGSSGSIQTLPVQFSTEFGLHVEAYVKNSSLNKETIRSTILTLIDRDMLDGTINLAVLAKDISKELGDNVVYVDVLGLNGDRTQQTMIPVSDDTYPQLKQVLTIYDDNTVHVDRALSLDWYVIN